MYGLNWKYLLSIWKIILLVHLISMWIFIRLVITLIDQYLNLYHKDICDCMYRLQDLWRKCSSKNNIQTIATSISGLARLSDTSENWRRTSRSCITVVQREKWKNQIPKRAGTADKSISTGLLYKRAVWSPICP